MSYKCVESWWCNKVQTNSADFRQHLAEHKFEDGFICPISGCSKFMKAQLSNAESLKAIHAHTYSDHGMNMEISKQATLDPGNYVRVSVGRFFCGNCKKILDLGGGPTHQGMLTQPAMAHIEAHVVKDGSATVAGSTEFVINPPR
ncbi:hypothetical protein BJX76DRAFT_355494 [Aspergillus varians]